MSGKKALCVGINQYKNYPSSNLQGCVNDVIDMVDVLKTFLGFTDADIVKLTDAQATKANIMAALKEMVDGAKAGKYSYLVYSQSGHGTQVPDTSGDEPDRADEAFCPHDLAAKGNQWDPAHVIVDDELHDLFTQLPPNALLEVYLDTCHSGTGLKAIDLLLDRKPKYIPPPSLEAFGKVDGKTPRGLFRALTERGIVHHILWAGCRDNQTSADANIGGSWHGAFTYCFCKAMRDSKNKISRAQMLVIVNQCLKAGKYTQVAQLEGEATKRSMRIS
jgi:metacaspase-1